MQHGALLWGGLAAATTLTILFGIFPTTILPMVSHAADAISTIPR